MPRAIKVLHKKPGFPPKNIDWKLVDDLLEAGCTGTQIAGRIGVSPDTLYDRCVQEKRTSFSLYAQQKAASGESILAEVQFKKAKAGDTVMLVWLGKNRMKQSDSPQEIAISEETLGHFKAVMGQLSAIQSSTFAKAEISSSTDSRSECVTGENRASGGSDA